MPEPNRWNYLEFERPAADGAGTAASRSDRSWFLEIDGQDRIYTGGRLESRLLRRYLPEHIARRYQAIPIECRNGILKVAMADPDNPKLCRELERETNLRIDACRTTPEIVQQGLALYGQHEPPPSVPLRLHRPTLAPSPWIHTTHRAPARSLWPAYRSFGALVLLVTAILLLLLGPLFLGPLFLVQLPR